MIDRANELGRTSTVSEVETAHIIKSRFRIWKHAVIAAGLQPLTAPEQTYLRSVSHDSKLCLQALSIAEQEDVAAAIIETGSIVFDPGFRVYCEENLCGQYSANYSCPSDCGTPEQMRMRILAHPWAIVIQTKWNIPDWHDAAAIRMAKGFHNAAMLRTIARMKEADIAGLMCGASCCTLCDQCARTDGRPCPHPEQRFSCLSAYCIHVKKLAESCGMEYTCADGSLALFGLIVICGKTKNS